MGSFRWCVLAVAVTPWLFSCAPTKALETWKDDQYTRTLHKVMIIGAAQSEPLRKMFENMLARKMKERHLEAIPSHELFPELGNPMDRIRIVTKARELGVDSIFLARSISREDITTYQPGGVGYQRVYAQGKDFSFYGQGFVRSTTKYETENFIVATHIYDVASEKMVWTSVSEVWVLESKQSVVEPFVNHILQQLKKSNLI